MICPNCGHRSKKNFCPECGASLAVDPVEPQVKDLFNTVDRNTNTRNGPNPDQGKVFSGYDTEEQIFGVHKTIHADEAGLSDVARFIRKRAGSPLMLISAILITLYTGCFCYTCGASILNMTENFFQPSFDLLREDMKISSLLFWVCCFFQFVMSVWLCVAMWSLYSASVCRRKRAMQVSGMGSFQSCSLFGKAFFGLLTAISLLTLALMLFQQLHSPDEWSEFAQKCFCVAKETTFQATNQVGLLVFVSLLFENDIYRIAFISVYFLINAILFFQLFNLFAVSDGMFRFGEVSRRRVPHVALLVLLNGIVLIAGSIFAYFALGTEENALLMFGPTSIHGLASILCSLALDRYTVGIKRMQE